MARKRKILKNLDYQSPEYWNRLLVQEGLSLEQGRNPKLLYVGDSNDVDQLEGFIRTDNGRTPADEGAE